MRQERETNDPPGGKWVASTPAQAAGLTDHHWSVEELLSFCVPPAERPKWRGRRPKWLMEQRVWPDHGSMGYYHGKIAPKELVFNQL
jgi:hypothetical protein